MARGLLPDSQPRRVLWQAPAGWITTNPAGLQDGQQPLPTACPLYRVLVFHVNMQLLLDAGSQELCEMQATVTESP